MSICVTLSYFFAKNNHLMAQNSNPVSSTQVKGTQGNPARPISIDQHYLSSTAHQMFELRQSQSAIEACVISLQLRLIDPINVRVNH